MGLINILFRRDKFEKPAKITLKNIKKFLQGNWRMLLLKVGLLDKQYYIKEQMEWRKTLVKTKSPKCLEDDSCVICGCEVSSMLLSDPSCEGNCFPVMLRDAKKWEEYKIENKI